MYKAKVEFPRRREGAKQKTFRGGSMYIPLHVRRLIEGGAYSEVALIRVNTVYGTIKK